MVKCKERVLKYKDKPLVRSGDVLFYGEITEDYVIKLKIKSKKNIDEVNFPSIVSVDLLKSAAAAYGNFRPIKTGKKEGLFEALDLGFVWLERALKSV